MLKGYQHFAGRALTALDALEQCAEEIRTFRIVVFSASPEVVARVQELQLAGVELDIAILPHVGHDAMLRMFARARIYIGVSVSDAISTSLLEAIAMGTFPIQTDTSCCNEWIQDGVSGFSVPVDDIQVIADRICEAARNDELVDQAAVINWETVLQRLDQANLKQEAIDFYHSIFEVEDPQLQ
jgi:glycosyltransferase involved in cell wall biosynthesis